MLATLDGYAVEGGFDVSGGIATCYSPAIGLGRVHGPGSAAELWEHYEAAIDSVAELGLDGVRLTVEWARVEPRADVVDLLAWQRYQTVVDRAKEKGLVVTAVVVDAVWPAWLGPEAWLLPWVRPAFERHVARFAQYLGSHVEGVVAFSQRDALVDTGYLRGTTPPWRKRERADAQEVRRSLAAMEAMVHSNAILGPKVRTNWHEIPAKLPASAWPAVVAEAKRASEVHIKSLVRGGGPTASTSGLVTIRDGVAQGERPAALLDLWRS
jgi:beta-glucosidase/6-phospho-beta-glucosidase/beta-galactosidase